MQRGCVQTHDTPSHLPQGTVHTYANTLGMCAGCVVCFDPHSLETAVTRIVVVLVGGGVIPVQLHGVWMTVDSELPHTASTYSQHIQPAHTASTHSQHTQPAHTASTHSQHIQPAHTASTYSQHIQPAHTASTYSQHIQPACTVYRIVIRLG